MTIHTYIHVYIWFTWCYNYMTLQFDNFCYLCILCDQYIVLIQIQITVKVLLLINPRHNSDAQWHTDVCAYWCTCLFCPMALFGSRAGLLGTLLTSGLLYWICLPERRVYPRLHSTLVPSIIDVCVCFAQWHVHVCAYFANTSFYALSIS